MAQPDSDDTCEKIVEQLAKVAPKCDSIEKFQEVASMMIVMFLVSADRAVPEWAGRLVEHLAPIGRKAKKKCGDDNGLISDVEKAFQGFLKRMQTNQKNWEYIQTLFTRNQRELLQDSKGSLSYYT